MKTATLASLAAVMVLCIAGPANASEPVANWQQVAVKSFRGLEGTTKSQGMTSDGSQMYFSWNFGLHSTGLDMNPPNLAENPVAIPDDLRLENADHIGDIDYYDGKIYAPIEDGLDYLHPTIVPYDARTLEASTERYPLDTSKLTDGVPWIAIDAARQVAYTATWNNTTFLNVHRLTDFAITSRVALDQTVPRIQGAKVYKGNLYIARDNGPEKSIEAIDPTTGHVTHLFDRNLGDEDEAEGIAFVKNSDGTTMRTTDIVESDGSRVDIHSYRIDGDVTPPTVSGLKNLSARTFPGQKLKLQITSSEPVTADGSWFRCVGAKKHPCRKTKIVGRTSSLSLVAGQNNVRMPSLSIDAPAGKVLNPGWFRISLGGTDVADAQSGIVSTTAHILKPKR